MDTDEHGSEVELARLPTVSLGGEAVANHVTLTLQERSVEALPAAGDLRFSVAVSADGFAGRYDQVWVNADDWLQFLGELREVELVRRGRATLTAMSPDEFELHIWITDGWGHLAAPGFLGRHHWSTAGGRMTSRVSFTITLDPSRLRGWVEQFVAIQAWA